MSRYLINRDLKALRQGQFAKADSSVSEFILDTDSKDVPNMAVLRGIADAHGFAIKETKPVQFLAELEQNLQSIKLPMVNKMSDTDIIDKIVTAGHKAGKTDDDMLIEIVKAGVPFKNAGKGFKEAMERLGFRITTKDRQAEIDKILSENKFSAESYDEVKKAMEHIVKKVANTTDKQAISAIRKYAKANGIEIPKAERKERGAGGFKTRMYKWIQENPTATDAKFQKYLESEERSAGVVKKVLPLMAMVRAAVKTAMTPKEETAEPKAAKSGKAA